MWSEKGATLMELVVVVGVSAIVVGALVFATIASLRNAQFSKNQAQATKLAQEGIEWVRSGRDRNMSIGGNLGNVKLWNGSGSESIWNYEINKRCSTTLEPNCYFKVNDKGELTFVGPSDSVPESIVEPIPPAPAKAIFYRAVILSDDATASSPGTSASQKTVTVMVSWTDFSGQHQSRLTTILRKI